MLFILFTLLTIFCLLIAIHLVSLYDSLVLWLTLLNGLSFSGMLLLAIKIQRYEYHLARVLALAANLGLAVVVYLFALFITLSTPFFFAQLTLLLLIYIVSVFLLDCPYQVILAPIAACFLPMLTLELSFFLVPYLTTNMLIFWLCLCFYCLGAGKFILLLASIMVFTSLSIPLLLDSAQLSVIATAICWLSLTLVTFRSGITESNPQFKPLLIKGAPVQIVLATHLLLLPAAWLALSIIWQPNASILLLWIVPTTLVLLCARYQLPKLQHWQIHILLFTSLSYSYLSFNMDFIWLKMSIILQLSYLVVLLLLEVKPHLRATIRTLITFTLMSLACSLVAFCLLLALPFSLIVLWLSIYLITTTALFVGWPLFSWFSKILPPVMLLCLLLPYALSLSVWSYYYKAQAILLICSTMVLIFGKQQSLNQASNT